MIGSSYLTFAAAIAAGWLFTLIASADETCATCDRQVIVSGQYEHRTEAKMAGAQQIPGRWGGAFQEALEGTNFTITISGLPAGQYRVTFGLQEAQFTNAGERVFDINYGGEPLISSLDIIAQAGGAGKALFFTNNLEHADDGEGGPMAFQFVGRTGAAKFNLLELRNDHRQSVVVLRASDLLSVDDKDLEPPVITGPEVWKDPAQPIDERVADLVQRMSLSEKVRQLGDSAPAIPRLGVPAYNYWSECLHGVARSGVATVFPQAIGMAATWDVQLIHDEAGIIADEARAKNNDYRRKHNNNSARYYGLHFWTPNINIFRDPRWGRGQETYGEDPYLTGRLGVSFIEGLQGNDSKYIEAMACAKHFAVHSGPEPLRHEFNVNPPERDLYETYLPQFEMAVREGHVGGVMGAYNSLNGQPACANPFLLTDLLRKQWGFDGYVTSDCGAIFDIWANHKYTDSPEAAAALAIQAGDDLCCGDDFSFLVHAVKEQFLTPAEIDGALTHLLKTRFRLGMFDPPDLVPYQQIPASDNDTTAHRQIALQVARESMVLLKNNGILPLNRTQVKHILVVGTNANSVSVLLGNYNGTPSQPVTILDGIRSVAGPGVQVDYEPGCDLVSRGSANEVSDADRRFAQAVAAAGQADVVIYVGGINSQLEGEEMRVELDGFNHGDRTHIELPALQEKLLKALQVTGKPVVFVNCSGSAIAMPWEKDHLAAILQAWYPGEAGGQAVGESLFGEYNPSGRLPVTFYRSTADLPDFEDYSMRHRTYRYFSGQPLFAFGHGLSYTTFQYMNAELSQRTILPDGTLEATFTLKNSGARDGDEVVQAYFRHRGSTVSQPREALCAFQRVHLAAGESRQIKLSIPAQSFRYWDVSRKHYVVEAGKYELMLASASDDVRGSLKFKIAASKQPY